MSTETRMGLLMFFALILCVLCAGPILETLGWVLKVSRYLKVSAQDEARFVRARIRTWYQRWGRKVLAVLLGLVTGVGGMLTFYALCTDRAFGDWVLQMCQGFLILGVGLVVVWLCVYIFYRLLVPEEKAKNDGDGQEGDAHD